MGEYDADLALFAGYVANAEAVPYHSKWENANKNGDAPKWHSFRDSLLAGQAPAPPSMATRYGKALVGAGRQHMSISRLVGAVTNPFPPPDPTPDPPDPPTGTLRFSPPGYPNFTGFQTINIANNGSNSFQNLDDGTDYLIVIDDYVAPTGIQIIGGRNVVIRGGRITTTGVGLQMYEMIGLILWPRNGAVHFIEGLRIRPSPTINGGSELHDCIVIRHNGTYPSNANSRIILQNIRAGVSAVRIGSSDSLGHPDCIQWQSDYPGQVWMDKMTFLSDYTGFMQSNFVCGLTDMHRVNFRSVDVNTTSSSHATHLWMYRDQPNAFLLDDVWGEQTVAVSTFNGCFHPQPNAMVNADTAQWTGFNITGLWRRGVPTAGDFVTDSEVGVGYVSPGYA